MNGHDACGPGFNTPSPVVEGPAPPPGACACGTCSVTDPGSCTKGDFGVAIDGAAIGSCSLAGTLKANDGACSKLPVNYKTSAGSKAKVTAAPWTGPGACAQPQTPVGSLTYAGQGET